MVGSGEGEVPYFRDIKESLRESGFRPSRRLGQNFLLDPTLHRAIVRAARVGPGDRVVEIGCGPGFLTAHLLAAGAQVLAVEIDRRLIRIARQVLGPGVTFFQGDILASKNRLEPGAVEQIRRHGGRAGCRVVANLPYAVSGPLISLLALSDLPLSGMVCLVQKELAARILSGPGTKAWGGLGFAVGLAWRGEYLRPVPPQVFRPRPRVDSALVRLDRLPDPLLSPGPEAERAAAFCRRLFTQKRRTLAAAGRVLKLAHWPRLTARLGLAGSRRVVSLTVAELVALHQAFCESYGDEMDRGDPGGG